MWLKLIQIRIIDLLKLDSRKQESKEEKKRRYALIMAQGVMFFVILFISLLISSSFLVAGEKELIVGISFIITIILQLLITIFRINSDLYGYKEYDQIASFPISTVQLIMSRLGYLYLRNELIAILILYPMNILYLAAVHAHVLSYFKLVLLVMIVPVIPIMLSVIVDTVITGVSYHFKRAQLISKVIHLLLYAMIPVAVIAANYRILDLSVELNNQNVSQEMLQQFTFDLFHHMIEHLTFLQIYIKAVSGSGFMEILLIFSVSILSGSGTVWLLSKRYQKLHLKITTQSAVDENNKIAYKGKSELSALCEKEIRRFFSSGTCLLNLGIGPVFAIIFSLSLFLGNPNEIIRRLDFVGIALGTNLSCNSMMISMSFTIMALVAVCCYSGISISLEGEAIWILKSIPVSVKKIYLAKIIANLALTLPISVICAGMTILNVKGQLIYAIFIFVLPVSYGIWVATMGLFINLKFPKLEWNSEIEVVKQSTSSLICMLGEVGVALLLAFTIQLIPERWKVLSMSLLAVICVASSAVLYIKMCKDSKLTRL